MVTGKPKALPFTDLVYPMGRLSKRRYEVARSQFPALVNHEKSMAKDHEDMRLFGREVFTRLWRSDNMVKRDSANPTARIADHLHRELDKLKAWKDLVKQCQGDTTSAAAAQAVLMKHLAENVQLPEVDPEGDEEDMLDSLEDWLDDRSDDTDGQAKLRSSLTDAAKGASGAVKEYQDAIKAVYGAGKHPGEVAQGQPGASKALLSGIANNTVFRDLLRKLGAWRLAMTKATKTMHSEGHVLPYSVEPTRKIKRLLPGERVRLAMPETQVASIARLQRGEAMGYRLRSSKPADKGPFVVVLDRSGSMRKRWTDAAAFAMASVLAAHEQGREVSVITFGRYAGVLEFDEPLKAITVLAELEPRGGTSFDRMFARLKSHGLDSKTDVMLVTDGLDQFNYDAADAVLGEAKLHYILVGQRYSADPWLEARADQFYKCNELKNDMAKAATVGIKATRTKT